MRCPKNTQIGRIIKLIATTKEKRGILLLLRLLSEVVGNLYNKRSRIDTHAVGIYNAP